MPARKRIAVVDLASAAWSAGASYTESLVRTLTSPEAERELSVSVLTSAARAQRWSERPGVDVHLVDRDWASRALEFVDRSRSSTLLEAPARMGARAARDAASRVLGDAVARGASRVGARVLLPVTSPLRGATVPILGWIPDFQHVHEPSFFDEAERRARDRDFRAIAAQSARVILSSQSAKRDYDAFVPEHASRGVVASFPSLFAFAPPSGNPRTVVGAYRLPEKFALVVNQMWRHKNHAIVVDALAAARARGVDVPCVMVGAPSDYRDPSNSALSALLQSIQRAGVHDLVRILGSVPRSDLVSLLRVAAVCIQPSRFEGWSTTVEDAKALGRPIVASDLPVHREQVPGALGFFGCDAPSALADVLVDAWPRLAPGPDERAERRGLEAALETARAYRESILSMCRAAADRG